MEAPETRYAETRDGLSIAYQTLGDGPVDVLLIPHTPCIDVMWDDPSFAHFLRRLTRFGRLVCLDWRGFGASDPVPLGALPTAEGQLEDFRIVLDEIGSTSVSIIAHATTGFVAMLFAATYPERTKAIVLIDATARERPDDGYPSFFTPEVFEDFIEAVVSTWGAVEKPFVVAPSRAEDKTFLRWFARYERGSCSRQTIRAVMRWNWNLDVRPVLPAIRVPALVVYRPDAALPYVPEQTFYVAEHIPGAKLVSVPDSKDYPFYTDHGDELLDEIEEFITGAPPVREPDRALATVLFTDIVNSTPKQAEIGDARWKQLLDRHDDIVRRELERHRGRQIKTTGDGVLATFDGPARAIRCTKAILDGVAALGLEARAGLHTGEIELRGEDVTGLAVVIGQRVSTLAGPGEVLVTRTVTDLVAGSGLEFEDRGEHELKGVPRSWQVYAVTS